MLKWKVLRHKCCGKSDCRMEGTPPRPAFTRLVTASSNIYMWINFCCHNDDDNDDDDRQMANHNFIDDDDVEDADNGQGAAHNQLL